MTPNSDAPTTLHLVKSTPQNAALSERPASEDAFRTLMYRRYRGGYVWHYHPACTGWPSDSEAGVTEQRETPYGYPFCKECDERIALDYVLKSRRRETA